MSKVSIPTLLAKKRNSQKFAVVTCYDASFAGAVERADEPTASRASALGARLAARRRRGERLALGAPPRGGGLVLERAMRLLVLRGRLHLGEVSDELSLRAVYPRA